MKRGFLNTSKAKRLINSQSQRPTIQDENPAISQSKISESSLDSNCPSPATESGKFAFHLQGRNLHKLPDEFSSRCGARMHGRKRMVFLQWPRDPNGKSYDGDHQGKQAPNKIAIWGATLYDFYMVPRSPSITKVLTFSSGSKIAACMKAMGEVEFAKSEIEWAEQHEPEPRQILPRDITRAIEDYEWSTRFVKHSGKRRLFHVLPPVHLQYELVDGLPNAPPTLRKRLPFHVLPKRLLVHDPFHVLRANPEKLQDPQWMSCFNLDSTQPDVVQAFALHLSNKGEEGQREKDNYEEAEQCIAQNEAKQEYQYYKIACTTEGKSSVFARVPLRPQHWPSIPEAHLYLRPANFAGNGNHSIVYNAELELPRSVLVGRTPCDLCIFRQVLEKLHEYIRKSEDRSAQEPHAYHQDENLSSLVYDHLNDDTLVYSISLSSLAAIRKSQGPRIEVCLDEDAEDAPSCDHIELNDTPSTARVRVTAKLSLKGDDHLAREAENYQNFPDHFFEHWSGYNIIAPLHDPVPLGPIVPQFYGYYIPEEESSWPYISPILLIEHCGRPVDPHALDIDDRQECVSLLYRFHREGWTHGSFASRNIVQQPGPLYDPVVEDFGSDQPMTSFRLIDFGRSQIKDASRNMYPYYARLYNPQRLAVEKAEEEEKAARVFSLFHRSTSPIESFPM